MSHTESDVQNEMPTLRRLDHISAPAAMVDRGGRVLHANMRFAEMLGCRGRDLSGVRLETVLPCSDPGAFARVAEMARRRPREVHTLTIMRDDHGLRVQVDLLLRDLGAEEQTYVLAVERTPARGKLARLRRRVDELESMLETRAASRDAPADSHGPVLRQDHTVPCPALYGDVRMAEYLETQVQPLRVQHRVPGVPVTVAAGDVILDARRATLVGLIATELVTNALQHAFPEGGSGHVEVSLRRRDADYELGVADNGIGLASAMPTEPRALGLRLVQLYAQRLQARIALERGGGCRFIITFPREAAESGPGPRD